MIELIPLLLSCAATVHPDTIRDVAWVESRLNPYAIGVVGGDGIMPRTKAEAIARVKELEDGKKSYSVGLMQIHKGNFEQYGMTAEKLFEPCTNLAVFERIITDCYVRGKSLPRALSCYYSGNFETGKIKEKAFSDTSYVQRIGYTNKAKYLVPSTKADQEKTLSVNAVNEKELKHKGEIRTVYPANVIKNTAILPQERPTKILRGN
ncbi:transglycosylase [Pseudomonas fragi]|nr:transglycosylase [Pseudomonas fragi]